MDNSIPKIIFIVPYRNRIQQKHHFDIYMKYIMEDYNESEYKIFFSHQCDNRNFNRGAMKNIGFIAMKQLYPNHYKNITFVFNDIDTMPYKKNLLNYQTTQGIVKHFFGFDFALGGIVSITGADFERIGGYPNFWAWGLEDNALNNRVLKNKLKIDRSNFYEIHNHNIVNLTDSKAKVLSKENSWRFKDNNYDSLYDIKNLKYNIENEYINISSFNTKVNPADDTYYYSQYNAKIFLDKRFKSNNKNNKSLTTMNFFN